MGFDQCAHEMKSLLIKFGRAIRTIKGLPEEKNISILYQEAIMSLNVPHIETNTSQANHLPAPHEMMMERDGKQVPLIPRRDCPMCGEKEGMVIGPLCQGCQDAENGKFKTMWQCQKCQYKDRSEKHFMWWMSNLGVEMPTGTKKALGILTYTDDGMK